MSVNMPCDFIALAVDGVQHLQPYLPGKPADELARELGLSHIVKLASNENPLGVPPSAMKAMTEHLKNLALYPDSSGYDLKHAISQHFALTPEMITLGNGSNDVIELLGRAYLNEGVEAIYSEYAFVAYRIATQATGATPVVTPAKAWGHDLEAMLTSITSKTRLVFIANPNNPTGTWLTHQALTAFLDQVPEHVIVVLDEAYTEYVDEPEFPNGLTLLETYRNLVVTRTFSKAYGLAGLRVGYAASHPDIANVLSRVRQPFNVGHLGMVAAQAVLKDTQFLDETVKTNRQGLAYYQEKLTALGLSFIPSVGNFVTVDFKQDAAPIYQQLLKKGVITRPIANYGMPNHLRISVGTQSENEFCMNALAEVLN